MRKNEEFWDKRAKNYDDKVREHDVSYDRTIEGAKSLLCSSDVVLDVGCASGEMSLDIAPYVKSIHGIDVSGKMIQLARQKALDRQVSNVSFSQGDAIDEGLSRRSFSAIIAFNVFHLLDDVSKTLLRLDELLSSGGLLVSQTPCLGERNWIFRSFISLAQKVGLVPPIRSLTVAELESLVSDAKFGILESTMWDEKFAVQWIAARKM